MARKAEVKIKVTRNSKAAEKPVASKKATSSVLDYFRFGESYTSLILGIIVVIIGTVLLLSLVRNRVNRTISTSSTSTQTLPNQQEPKKIAQAPSIAVYTPKPTEAAMVVTKAPTPTPTTKPLPTKVVVSLAPKKTIKPTQPKTKIAIKAPINNKERLHVVTAGESLWSIAVKEYQNGYKWVDIARANNLSNPNQVLAGKKLIIPVEQKIATADTNNDHTSLQAEKITSTVYIVKRGDNLWSISVRAYGDGYKWVEIARVNNLSNPNLIHSGNKLKIPRS